VHGVGEKEVQKIRIKVQGKGYKVYGNCPEGMKLFIFRPLSEK